MTVWLSGCVRTDGLSFQLSGDPRCGGIEAGEIEGCFVGVEAAGVAAGLIGLGGDPFRVRPFGNPGPDRITRHEGKRVRSRKIRVRAGRNEIMGIDLVGSEQDSAVVHAGIEESGN